MIIGLTGGIASGKTTVTEYLRQQGFPIVDADVISRSVVEPGHKGLEAVVNAFGSQILEGDQLNRKKLRRIIFDDESKRLLLNGILHPIIHEEILYQIEEHQKNNETIIIFDAPLLLENKLQHMVDSVWVVSTSLDKQIDRVMSRDDINREEALKIINRQMSLEEKASKADLVLINNDGIEDLYKQIDQAIKNHL